MRVRSALTRTAVMETVDLRQRGLDSTMILTILQVLSLLFFLHAVFLRGFAPPRGRCPRTPAKGLFNPLETLYYG